MRTLIPPEITAPASLRTRASRIFGFGLTSRALLLFAAGLLLSIPAFFHLRSIWIMFAFDALLLALILSDTLALPTPAAISVTRRFLDSPRLGEPTRVELEVTQQSNAILHLTLTDDLDSTLLPIPQPLALTAFPRDPARTLLTCYPGRRGDHTLGPVYLRYRARLQLVERWAVAPLAQPIRVFPAMEQNGESTSLYLIRARQLELQKRRLRQRGMGREFESLRDYQPGDELRNLSWTATARRGKLITRQFTMERSQQVWVVLDAGRLSRTTFVLARRGPQTQAQAELQAELQPELQSAESPRLAVTQLDQAATAAVMLAQAVAASGDRCGLLTYGREVQQQLLPGIGAAHLRGLIDQLSQVRPEAAEANHLNAAARLKHLQRRRGLILWITEIADGAGRPDVVAAATDLVRRHLVLLVLLQHQELNDLAARTPATVDQMYVSAAAQEMLTRRREVVARLRQAGVLVVECTPASLGTRTINAYLDIKSRGLL